MLNDYSLHYARFHPDTDEHKNTSSNHFSQMLAPCMPEDKNGQVLDIGCGFGYAMLGVIGLGFENVEGAEISQQQADQAAKYGLRVHVTGNTQEWLLRRKGRYATVLLLDVLEHIPVYQQVSFLKSVYSSLQRDGRIIVQTPNANSILATRWRYIDHTHHTSFTEHSLHYVLASAGFKTIKIQSPTTQRPSLRPWRPMFVASWRKYLIRRIWQSVYRAELPDQDVDSMSFELNHLAVAIKSC